MARGLRLLALLLAALASLAPAQAARRALVIGIDSYEQVDKLANARADARAMADALRAAGFEVVLRSDRTLRALRADVREFKAAIQPGDEVAIFFSGHGVQIGGVNYLLPADVGRDSEAQVRDEALALSDLLQDLADAKPRFTLAMIDACRDNPFRQRGRAIGARGLAVAPLVTGQMVIYAAGEGQRALDRLGPDDRVPNGLFTRVFLAEMKRPGVSVREVLFNVRDQVASLAERVQHEQVPAVYDQVRGSFYFFPLRATSDPASGATALPAGQVDQLADLWQRPFPAGSRLTQSQPASAAKPGTLASLVASQTRGFHVDDAMKYWEARGYRVTIQTVKDRGGCADFVMDGSYAKTAPGYFEDQAAAAMLAPKGAPSLRGEMVLMVRALPDGPYTCKAGYVFRQAWPEDRLCVTPQRRMQVEDENTAARAWTQPDGSCVGQAVWRLLWAQDRVCVTVESKVRALNDPSLFESDKLRACPGPARLR